MPDVMEKLCTFLRSDLGVTDAICGNKEISAYVADDDALDQLLAFSIDIFDIPLPIMEDDIWPVSDEEPAITIEELVEAIEHALEPQTA